MDVEKPTVTRISSQPPPAQIMIDRSRMKNVEYFNHWDSIITNDATYTRAIKFTISMAKETFDKKNNLFTSKLDFNSRKETVKCYI